MRKPVLILLSLLLLGFSPLLAQEKTITGKVTGSDGLPLGGVTVTVKGTSRVTQTNSEGNFSIQASNGQVLVFSFVGHITKEATIGNSNNVSVRMESADNQMDEVVVTAFGQTKEKKALGYSVQKVGGDVVAQTGRTNFLNALQGRVAGLDIGSTGGMAGASSTIVLRGGTSFDGNNQPLFVIDGIPVDNSTLAEGSLLNDGANRGSDYNNRIADVDPNDIENITVLKGPAATALYGIDAANGAIVITTKKGRSGKMSITYNNNFRFEENTRFPDRQSKYGTGTQGRANDSTISHWGAEIPAGTPIYDNVKNFFKTGFLNSHNISVSGGTDLLSGNITFNQLNQDGTVPHTGYKRQSLKMSMASEISPRLHVNGSANYIYSNTQKGTKGANSFYYYALVWPITADMRNWQDENGQRVNLLDVEDNFDNPYFDLNRNGSAEDNKRILLNGSVSYDVAKWFNITGRAGYDSYTTYGLTYYDPLSNQTIPNKSNAKAVGGVMLDYTTRFSLLNYYLLMNFKHKIGDFNGTLTTGLNVDDRNSRTDSRYGETFIVPNLVSINNTDRTKREAETRGYRRRLIGVFGDFKIDYKNYLFLNLTGRNDWSSTLPIENRSFFYPSASLSFVFTDAIPSLGTTGFLSYGKLRASVAQVGKDAPPHRFDPALTAFTRTGGGFAVGFFGPNPNIKPETTTSFEVGGEFRFLNNRLSLDVTYYKVRSKDQIVSPRLSYASGYILQLVNAGTMQNQGLEIMATGKPIVRKNFSWDVNVNFYFNRNKVIALPGGFTEFYLSDTWLAGNVRAGYVPGQSYYSFTGYGYKTNEKGQTLIGTNGYPVRDATFHYIGNRQPKFNMGISNIFRFKNFYLSMLWDWRNGGDIFNGTEYALTAVGLSTRTLDRGKTMVFPGVDQNTGQTNTQEVVLSQDYFTSASLGGLNEINFIERNISWLRLRDINLTYSVPDRVFSKTFIKGLDISAGASNLVLITNYSGADPDVNGLNASNRGSGAVGFDYFSLPAPIAFQIGINARF